MDFQPDFNKKRTPPIVYMSDTTPLTPLFGTTMIPWDRHDFGKGFTLYTLGQYLKTKKPYMTWLRNNNIRLVEYPADLFNAAHVPAGARFFALLTPAWHAISKFPRNATFPTRTGEVADWLRGL